MESIREELKRERDGHTETKRKLTSAEREAKSSTLMNLELDDYQRSIRSMEEELSGREEKLGSARRESQLHQDKIHQLMKELGGFHTHIRRHTHTHTHTHTHRHNWTATSSGARDYVEDETTVDEKQEGVV